MPHHTPVIQQAYPNLRHALMPCVAGASSVLAALAFVIRSGLVALPSL